MKVSDLNLAGPWTRSSPNSCVEVAPLHGGGSAIRDSKDPDGNALVFNVDEMRAFFTGVKAGEYDHLI